jgi:hypothetical protein
MSEYELELIREIKAEAKDNYRILCICDILLKTPKETEISPESTQ